MNVKRGIALLLVLVALLSFGATAEEVELASLSDEQVVALLRRVQEEIVARHIEATATLMGGAYIAGRDIPAGAYVYTCMASGDDWGNVSIYSEEGEGKQLFWKVVLAPDEGEPPEAFFITLNTGDRLKSDVPFSLTIYAGVTFK